MRLPTAEDAVADFDSPTEAAAFARGTTLSLDFNELICAPRSWILRFPSGVLAEAQLTQSESCFS